METSRVTTIASRCRSFHSDPTRRMKTMRRWLIYRRIFAELSDVPGNALGEIGTRRNALRDFAWHCAGIEVDRRPVKLHPLAGRHCQRL